MKANVYLFRWMPENFSTFEKQHVNFLKLATEYLLADVPQTNRIMYFSIESLKVFKIF